MATNEARRGWRERVEPGLYRAHRTACPSSIDRRPERRCSCSWELQVPGVAAGRSRTVTVTGTLTEARAERRRLMAAGRPVAAAVPAVESGTLDAFAGHVLRARSAVLAPSTIRGLAEGYRLYVSPALGSVEVAALTRESVEGWIAELSATQSRHAVWKAHKALRAIMKAALEWGYVRENPAAGVRLPKAPPRQAAAERVLTAGQLAALLAGTRRARIETMLRAAAEAGLRAGEVAGLRWGDLDLAGRRLTVERSVWQEAGRDDAPPRRIVKTPKGGRSRRVAISSTFAARLGDWYAEAVVEGGADAAGYVWPGRAGGPMDSATAGQALARVLDRVGLVDGDGRPLVTFHGLRHTAASLMLAAGVPQIVVSRQLGHANPNITATVYAHLLDDSQLDDAAAVFDAAQLSL